MILNDFETGEEIVNPYIRIENSEGEGVYMNTFTFYTKIKKLLKIDERAYKRFPCLKNRKLYKVFSVTGFPHTESSKLGISLLNGVEKKDLSPIELGLIKEKDLKFLPKTHSFLSEGSKGNRINTEKYSLV